MISVFLKRLLVFLVPVLLGFCFLEFSLRAIPNDYAYKNEFLTNNAEEIEVLIFGNSHYYRGIIAEELKLKSFNAAYVSQSLDLDFKIFNKFKNRLTNLKYLVIGVSYHSLFTSLESGKESWRLKNYNLYYDFRLSNNPIDYSEVLSNTWEFNRQRWINFYWLKKNPLSSSSLGSGAKNSNKNFFEVEQISVKSNNEDALSYCKAYYSELNNIIAYCKQKNIKVIFLSSPTYKTYYENLNEKQFLLMNKILDSLLYINKNVCRLDYLKNSNFSKRDFFDSSHLNVQGATKFTNMLNHKLDSLNSIN